MHTTNFGVYQLLSITSVCKTLLHECPSIRSRFRNLQHNQQASAHIIHWMYNWEGCSRLSVEHTPLSLVSINSSPSPLSAKVCSKCAHQSVQDLEICSIINWPIPISEGGGILGRAVVVCTPPNLLSTSSSPSPLSAKLCFTCVHRSVQNLEICSIISRPVPISYTRGIIGRAVVVCPSNAQLQVWCLPTPLHHVSLLN